MPILSLLRRPLRLIPAEGEETHTSAIFVTLCTKHREHLLGEIVHGDMILNEFGQIAWNEWFNLTDRFPWLLTDSFVVMPNHLHGILWVNTQSNASEGGGDMRPQPLGVAMKAYRTSVTERINNLRGTPGIDIWQDEFYRHTVRDDDECMLMRAYIAENPSWWDGNWDDLMEP